MKGSRKFNPLHKIAEGLLIVLFIWSSIAIALDQHNDIYCDNDDKYSDICLIHHAKNVINGTANSFVLNVHLVSAHYYLTEKLFNVTIPITLSCQGRAPPGLFQS
jgi:hypothetical protein